MMARMARALALMLAVTAGGKLGAAQDQPGVLAPAAAAEYFAQFEAACARDGGALWGVDIHGPVLLVDPRSREVIANMADEEGMLEEHGGAHVGRLPPEVPVANAPVEWAGRRWAMVMAPWLGDDAQQRVTMLAHESFHRVQPELGLYTVGPAAEHLDEADGRYWLQLEWNALQAALASDGEARAAAVGDALAFRAARRERFADGAMHERRSEILEGLAQYTGMRIAGAGAADVLAYVESRREQWEHFGRMFAYLSGPLLGYLLDDADPKWRESVTAETDLGALLAEAMGIEVDISAAARRAGAYGGPALRAEADARAQRLDEQRAEWRALLVDGPVLILDLSVVSSATMDTRAAHGFDATSTVFTVRGIKAEWGVLRVEGGAILEDRATRRGRLSLRGASDDWSAGEGWTLEIAEGWIVAPGEREGDRVLRRE